MKANRCLGEHPLLLSVHTDILSSLILCAEMETSTDVELYFQLGSRCKDVPAWIGSGSLFHYLNKVNMCRFLLLETI